MLRLAKLKINRSKQGLVDRCFDNDLPAHQGVRNAQ
jgi:hypothetical protein